MNYEIKANEIYQDQLTDKEKLEKLINLSEICRTELNLKNLNSGNLKAKVGLDLCQHYIVELKKKILGEDTEDNQILKTMLEDEKNESAEVKKMIDVSNVGKK
jgi:hypothetical protein